jgi:hypothetical protein
LTLFIPNTNAPTVATRSARCPGFSFAIFTAVSCLLILDKSKLVCFFWPSKSVPKQRTFNKASLHKLLFTEASDDKRQIRALNDRNSSLSCIFFGPSPSLQSWARMMALVSVMLQLCERRPDLARKLVPSANKFPQPISTTSSQYWHIISILMPTQQEGEIQNLNLSVVF